MSKAKKMDVADIPQNGEQVVELKTRVKLNGKYVPSGATVRIGGAALKRLVAEGACQLVEPQDDPLELTSGTDSDDGL